MKYKQKRDNQKGGLLLPYKNKEKSREIFSEFIQNAESIGYISKGTYGIILKANLGQNTISNNYSQIRPDEDYGKPVSSILIKICIIADKDYTFKIGPRPHDTISTVKSSNFQNEINIQTDIYLKTIHDLQPLCPGIVYANILRGDHISPIADKILEKLKDKKDRMQPILSILFDKIKNDKNLGLGIIGMEFMENSNILHDFNMDGAYNISRYALLRLALDTGYNHNDFHKGNIMLEENKTYFNNISKRPILIDFGRATKIPPEIMKLIETEVAKNNYIEALKYLCHYKTANEFTKDPEYNSFYGWVCGDYNVNDDTYLDEFVKHLSDEQKNKSHDLNIFEKNIIKHKLRNKDYVVFDDMINAQMEYLFEMRKEAIKINAEKMKSLHNKEAHKYPLLPVPNNIKNYLYEGMITEQMFGGKKKRTRKYLSKKSTTQKRK